MEAQLLIDNESRPAKAGATFERRHPVTNEVVTRAAAGSVEDAAAAVESASTAFKSWRNSPPSERRRVLLKAADALEARTQAFIDAMAAEVGASGLWAGFNVYLAANLFREAASLATQIQGETIPTDKPGALSMTVRQPVGVILSIVPWNGPVVLAARAIAYPIVCGNTVVFRASEASPRTHALVAEALVEAGLPPGVLNMVTNAPQDAPEVIDALIAHKAVRRINFTGSTRVGRIIAQKAATQLKRCLLELGGKSPLVVLDDANIDEAVKAAVFGSFLYQGQICMSTERIIVHEAVADAFIARFRARVEGLRAGDPRDGSAPLGSVIEPEAAARIARLIDDAVAKGATLIGASGDQGTLLSAAALIDVTPDMEIYAEESFGPITTVIRARDDDEAVRIANDTEYGLTSSVFGRDIARAMAVADRIEAGMCHINGPTVHDEAQMPFGGTKSSGYGRFGGEAGIAEFTELKWMTIETQPLHLPI